MDIQIRILQVSETDLLNQLIKLADDNRSQLGFMPQQALTSYAKSGQLIIAVEKNKLLGYLLFRRVSSKYSAAIAHLCVEQNSRGSGIPKELFNYLKTVVKQVSYISLKCRRDYNHANKMWSKLGFIPKYESKGRSLEGKPLTHWFYSFNNQFELFEDSVEGERLSVLLDANVFFDLNGRKETPSHIESYSLTADWLSDDIELCITDEIFVEINRNENTSIRDQNRKFARNFKQLKYDKLFRDNILSEISKIIVRPDTRQNLSDLTHVANAIAVKARYFITRDVATIEQSATLFEKYGLMVRRPVDLIVDIDALKNNDKYVESRFVEHGTSFSAIKSSDINQLSREFVNSKSNEAANLLRDRIRLYVSKPQEYSAEVWKGSGDSALPHATIVWRESNGRIEVILLRCKSNYSRLVERRLKTLILLAAEKNLSSIVIIDEQLPDVVKLALTEYKFFRDSSDNYWRRFVSSGIRSRQEILVRFENEFSESGNLLPTIKNAFVTGETSSISLYNAEKGLWPGKISEAVVPCYIVPIQPKWARNLFDEQISESDIFGFDSTLLFNRRNVYYRSAQPRAPKEGRVLWYVSKGKGKDTYGQIRASSYVESVTVASAKSLFKKYESLGIYKWSDIYELSGQDAQKQILCFEFSDTELFRRPVSFGDIQLELLRAGRKANQFAGPVEISHELFMEIYRKGC